MTRRDGRRAPQHDADAESQHVLRDAALVRLHVVVAARLGERGEEQDRRGS